MARLRLVAGHLRTPGQIRELEMLRDLALQEYRDWLRGKPRRNARKPRPRRKAAR